MNILSLKEETFDSFLLESEKIHKKVILETLKKCDDDIYASVDRKRFIFIRFDERTILSSYGIICYKRRYYYDSFMDEYCYLLDNKLQIPKSKRMTNELILKILDLASIMTYKEVGEHLSNEFTISKYTVWKTINEILLETYFDTEIKRDNEKIHIQIDEKFIGMTNSPNKKRYYTLTIFAGKKLVGKSYRLLNKTVISSSVLKDLKNKVNDILVNRYHISPNEEIFISGDLATYIQHFNEFISCCKSRYVPDKFHVYKALKDTLPDVYVDDVSLNNKDFQNYLIKRLSEVDNVDAKKVRTILIKNPKLFKSYLDPLYLGCSPDNSACEGFFGILKNEFYYSRDWKLVTTDEFIIELEKYLNWFCNKRIKKRLNYMNNKEYMVNYLKQV